MAGLDNLEVLLQSDDFMFICSSQQRKIHHLCMGAVKCKNGSKVTFKINFLELYLLMAKKEGKRSNSINNCGARKWNQSVAREVRFPDACLSVEEGCVCLYTYVCIHTHRCVYVHMYVFMC